MSLPTTTLSSTVSASTLTVPLASVASVTAIGLWIFTDGEAMRVTALPDTVSKTVSVQRGVGGSSATAHASGLTAYVGQPTQFYQQDPEGTPPTVPTVLPWINVLNGNIWTVSGSAWVLTGGETPTGDVIGPSSATDGALVLFDGTTGKLVKDGVTLGSDVVVGPASVTDGVVALFDGTTGKLIKADAAGVTAGPFTVITSITVVNGLVTDLQGS